MGNLEIENNDSDDENPYATKSSAKRETTTTSTGYDARDTYRQSQTSSAIGSSSTKAPRSNFARVKSDNVKNAGGTIFVTEAARAIGRQRYRDDDSSDSEYGYM